MDRRHFFKTLLSSSLMTPFLVSAESRNSGGELYLISGTPQKYLSLVLEELIKIGCVPGRSYGLESSHPFGEEIERSLKQAGWRKVFLSSAGVSLSSSLLRDKRSPSFTLVNKGEVWDIRTKNLSALWEEMNKKGTPSPFLTIASFKKSPPRPPRGHTAAVYTEGRLAGRISLKENLVRSFVTRSGRVVIKVEQGKASVVDSSCPQKICLSSFPVSASGERIICAPNHFLLEIEGARFIDTVIG